ncbi:MAG: DUF4919 domain-containing protein [Lentimicrobium sp.]|nr:DUF4919 domain-containing protein [Lentimicrobium sp.]
MKKSAAIILLILMPAFALIAQKNSFNVPDYKKISKAVSKAGSPTYYPALLNRLNQNDTSLSLRDYHLLYYGYVLQPEYKPAGSSEYPKILSDLLKKEMLEKSDYETIVSQASALLSTSPFEIEILDIYIQACRLTGNQELAGKLEIRFGRLIETIFSSGDGLSKQTPFYVITVQHQMDMIRALGFSYGGQRMRVENKFDFLKVQKNDFDIEGLYFVNTSVNKSLK